MPKDKNAMIALSQDELNVLEGLIDNQLNYLEEHNGYYPADTAENVAEINDLNSLRQKVSKHIKQDHSSINKALNRKK